MKMLLIKLADAAHRPRYDGQLDEIRRLVDALCQEQNGREVRRVPWWKRLFGIR